MVYDPSRNDIVTAARGRSAYMNDRRLRVSRRIRLQEGLVSTGFPFRPGDNFKSCLAMMNDLMLRTGGLQPWDVAAGSQLVTVAGGGRQPRGRGRLHGLEGMPGRKSEDLRPVGTDHWEVQQVCQRRRKSRAVPDAQGACRLRRRQSGHALTGRSSKVCSAHHEPEPA